MGLSAGVNIGRSSVPLSLNAKKEQQFGITLWIYNEKPQQDSVRFEFLNEAGEVSIGFLSFTGCWLARLLDFFAYMNGNKKDKKYRRLSSGCSPTGRTRIFLTA